MSTTLIVVYCPRCDYFLKTAVQVVGTHGCAECGGLMEVYVAQESSLLAVREAELERLREAIIQARRDLWWFIERDTGQGEWGFEEHDHEGIATRAMMIQDDVLGAALAAVPDGPVRGRCLVCGGDFAGGSRGCQCPDGPVSDAPKEET